MELNANQHRLYYISDPSFTHLKKLATIQGYLKSFGVKKSIGMSEFLSDLAYMDFEDTRPRDVVERHNQMIKYNRAPIWTSHASGRRTRALYLPQPAMHRYFRVALQVGIIREEPWIIGGPSKTRPVSVIGYVLEGIGLEWITPTRLPIKRTALE